MNDLAERLKKLEERVAVLEAREASRVKVSRLVSKGMEPRRVSKDPGDRE